MATKKKQSGIIPLTFLKDKKLVSSPKYSEKGVEFVLKKYKDSKQQKKVYLSDVFTAIPPGVLYKEETGMGATSLELSAPRHSIIVEPIKITASSKAHSVGALYVGSKTKYHSSKSVSVKTIQAYANNTTIPYKKIVVVADSLPKVIKALGPTVFQDYFLLIDEIDSFQLDSTFRKSMELAIDFYKKFDKTKRALLSATMIEFSDPDLKAEPLTTVKYDQPYKRNINLIVTDVKNLPGVVIDHITGLLTDNPKDKVFVAFNSVSGCLNMAEHLVKEGLLKDSEVKILCSSASAAKADKYFHELDSENLPARVNFFTSAYFTGYDLQERYHLVSVSSNLLKMHSLSDKKLKQIEGRCRPKVLSETIIHDIAISGSKDEDVAEQELIEAGKDQAAAMNCTRNHYKKSVVLKMILSDFTSRMVKFLEEKTFMYARENSEGEFVISYLNIDATLEANRVKKELYRKPLALYSKLLSDGNKVQYRSEASNTTVDASVTSTKHRQDEIDKIINALRKVKDYADLEVVESSSKITSLQRKIVRDFKKLYKYVETDKMLDLMRNSLRGRDSRAYNSLMKSAMLHVYPKGHLAVDRLDFHFPVKMLKDGKWFREKLTPDVIKLRMDMYLSELGIQSPPKDDTQAVKLLEIFRKVSRQKDHKTGKVIRVVTGENPLSIPVLKHKPATKGEEILTAYFNY